MTQTIIIEHFQHDVCPECGHESQPLENVPDQTLRGSPNCENVWFEDLNRAPLIKQTYKMNRQQIP